MNKQQPVFLKSVAACLVSLTLMSCGESDLVALQKSELDDARLAASQEPDAGAANPGTGGDAATDAGTDSGSDTGNTGGTDAANGGTDNGSTGTDTSGGQSSDSIDLSLYDLVFADDFRGSSIDPVKWNTSLSWGPDLVIYDQMQYYVDIENQPDFGFNPFTLDGEQLTITAIQTPDNLRASANEQPWLSGVLTTAGKFDFTYGYVEARVDLPTGQGIWPAFWMLSSEFTGLKPELFVMEYDGAHPGSVFHNYNYQDADGNLRSPGQWEVTDTGISDGFHRIGVSWAPQELLFYIDGQPRFRIVGENVAQQDMYMILNLAMGGVWTGAPDATTGSEVSMVVDYVRAYRLK